MYSSTIRTQTTAATANHAIWAVWNPHSTQRVKLLAFDMMQQQAMGAGTAMRLRRTTARGTPGGTGTPGIGNHSLRGIAPASGLLLDRAPFSVQPTLETGDIAPGFVFTVTQGNGLLYYEFPGGVEIGPGAGLAWVQVAATALSNFQVSVYWLEDW